MNIEFLERIALISDFDSIEEEFLKNHLSWGELSYRVPLEVVPLGIIPVTEKVENFPDPRKKAKKVTLMLAQLPDGRLYTLKHALIYVLDRFGDEIRFDKSSLPEEDGPDRLGTIDPEYLPGITFRDYQEKTINKALAFGSGIVMSAVGSGKTEMQIAISGFMIDNKISEYVLVICPSLALVDNFYSRCKNYSIENVQKFTSGGHISKDKQIIVANIDAIRNQLSKKGKFYDILLKCSTVIFDEAHHLRADTFYQIVVTINPEHLYEFSGTPFQNNDYYSSYEDFLVFALSGRIVASVPTSYLISKGYLAQPYFIMLPVGKHHRVFEKAFNTVYSKYLVKSSERNKAIVEWVKAARQYDLKVVVLVQRIEHMEILLELFYKSIPEMTVVGVKGSKTGKSYDSTTQSVVDYPIEYNTVFKNFENGDYDTLIITSVGDEGIDVPSCGMILPIGGQKSFVKINQRIGRGLRSKKTGRNEVYIVDFMDNSHPYLLKHSKDRRQHYISAGALEITPQEMIDRIYVNYMEQQEESE